MNTFWARRMHFPFEIYDWCLWKVERLFMQSRRFLIEFSRSLARKVTMPGTALS